MIALCVPNDVYLSYSILILTSVFRIAYFPLNLRTALSHTVTPSSSEPSLPAITGPAASATFVPNDLLTPMEGPPAYASLLGTEVFTPPGILTRRSSLPRHSSGAPAREFMLTPDTLRLLGTQVTSITTHIRAVLLAHRIVEDRVELQKAEFARMQEKCGEMLRLIGLLKERVKDIQGSREEGIVGRVERMKGKHKELMKRADRVLQALMNGASPELSECETKWFDELGRMKAEVIGAGKFDERSLRARTALVSDDRCSARYMVILTSLAQLQREYERIMPSLKDAMAKEEQKRKRISDNSRSLGVSQAFELGERSSIEYARRARKHDGLLIAIAQKNQDHGVGEGDCEDGVADAVIARPTAFAA